MQGYRYPFIVFLLISILVDSIAKSWFWKSRPDLYSRNFLDIIYFDAHQNSGLMLGIGSSLDSSTFLLFGTIFVGILLAGLFGLLIYRGFSDLSFALAWGLVVGGGLSNLLERLHQGAVTDFIIIDLDFIQSGIFNLADLGNLLGISFLVISVLFYNRWI